MSSALSWEPLHRKKKFLSDKLKYAIQKKYGDPVSINLGEHDIPYLEGLKDAGINDAAELIEAIKKYEIISVNEEF